jgi:hypothetical protein
MGLFGSLIIDPYEPEPHPLGKKPIFDAPDEWRYKPEHERFWALYAIDPRWHTLHHLAGFCLEDAGLNDYDPKYFLIGRHPQRPGGPPITGDAAQPVAVSAPLGENILLRILDGQWHPVDIDLGDLAPFTRLIEADGRALRTGLNTDGLGAGEAPVALPWNDFSPHRIAPAERIALLVRPDRRGVFPVKFTYRHWITNEVLGVASTTVTVV